MLITYGVYFDCSCQWLDSSFIRELKAIYSYLHNYHFYNLLWTRFTFFTFRNTINCDTIVLGFSDIENYWYSNFKCYLVWIVCIQIFIDFYFSPSVLNKLSNACCHGEFHKIKTLPLYLIIKETFIYYKTKKGQLIGLLETLIWIFCIAFILKNCTKLHILAYTYVHTYTHINYILKKFLRTLKCDVFTLASIFGTLKWVKRQALSWMDLVFPCIVPKHSYLCN